MRNQVTVSQEYRQGVHNGQQMVQRVLFALLILFLFYSHQANALNSGERIVTASIVSDGIDQIGHKGQARMLQLVRGLRAFGREDYHLARRNLLPLAKQGVVEAQFYVGMMYDSGLGVEKDLAEAFGWYQFAAYEGHSSAQHNLAVAYANGEGITPNSSKAIYWWKQAAQQGNADAQYNLGIVYAVGKLGIKPNINQAKNWWRKAAIGGDAMAQYNLGILYANGKGSVRSYCEATRWWEQSAKNGVQQANTALEILKHKKDYYTCW